MPGEYYPGSAPTLSVTVTQRQTDGTYRPVNVSPLNAHVRGPDGVVQLPAVVNDGVGAYHAVFAIPLSGLPGTWVYWFETSSVTPELNGLEPSTFLVKPLP